MYPPHSLWYEWRRRCRHSSARGRRLRLRVSAAGSQFVHVTVKKHGVVCHQQLCLFQFTRPPIFKNKPSETRTRRTLNHHSRTHRPHSAAPSFKPARYRSCVVSAISIHVLQSRAHCIGPDAAFLSLHNRVDVAACDTSLIWRFRECPIPYSWLHEWQNGCGEWHAWGASCASASTPLR